MATPEKLGFLVLMNNIVALLMVIFMSSVIIAFVYFLGAFVWDNVRERLYARRRKKQNEN